MDQGSILGQMAVLTKDSTETVKEMVTGQCVTRTGNLTREDGREDTSMGRECTGPCVKIFVGRGVMVS